MFISNKYYSYYYSIVDRAKKRTLAKNSYVERHHVIPKSLGGTNEKSNIVSLTAREHLVCHLLLIKMTEGIAKSKMANAAWRMVFSCKNHKRHKVNSRTYESLRIKVAEAARERNKTYKHSDESKRKISESKINKKRAKRTEEWVEKLRQANLGKKKSPCSDERKKKISNAKTGVKLGPQSIDHRTKVSDSKKGKKIHVDTTTGRRYFA